MKAIFLVLFLLPVFALAQSGGDAKKDVKTTKQDPKTEAKPATVKPSAPAKATTAPAPVSSGTWVCGDSDVWHVSKDCNALKNCKQTITDGKGKAKRACKMCDNSTKTSAPSGK